MTDQPVLSHLPVCVLCGGDLATRGHRCDHGPALRGEAGWVAEPRLPRSARVKLVLGGMLRALLPAGIGVTLLMAAVACLAGDVRRGWPSIGAILLPFGAVGVAVGFGRVREGVRKAATRRYRGWSRAGNVEAEGESAPGLWLGGKGQVRMVERLPVHGPPLPSSSLLAGEGGSRSFTLLRAALMTLSVQGHVTLRVERRLGWARREGEAPPYVHVGAVDELWMQPACGSGELPWLEAKLLEALHVSASHAEEGEAVVPHGIGSPYREAPPAEGPPPPAEGWVTLGALLRTFFRLQRGQPFHHAWMRARVIAEGLSEPRVSHDLRALEASNPELALLLSAAAQRRSMTGSPRATRP